MAKTAIKQLTYQTKEYHDVAVIAWQDQDTDEITVSIENDECMENIEIGTIMDVYQLRHILNKMLKEIDQ